MERLHHLQTALERNDPAKAMALIDDDLKQDRYELTGQNLGLLAHSGSYTALQRLRDWAAGPPNQAPFIHLWIGHASWPIAGLRQAGNRVWERQEIAAAIPVYLAWESLADQRPCSVSSEMGQARVCDVVANHVMDNLASMQIPPLEHMGRPGEQQIKQELCQNPQSRDKIVAMLRAHLAPVASEFYALAKWPAQPAMKAVK